MGINIAGSFTRDGAFPIDETLNLTKAEMLAVNDNVMPQQYLTICKDDGQLYLYDKDNPIITEIGRFRLLESGQQIGDITEQEIDEIIYGG